MSRRTRHQGDEHATWALADELETLEQDSGMAVQVEILRSGWSKRVYVRASMYRTADDRGDAAVHRYTIQYPGPSAAGFAASVWHAVIQVRRLWEARQAGLGELPL